MEQYLTYIILVVILLLLWLGSKMGSSKLMKVIFGNYLIGILCITFSILLNDFLVYLNTYPEVEFLWISFSSYADFIENTEIFILLIIYLALLVLWTQKSKINIHLPDSKLGKVLGVLLIPLAITGVLLTMILITYGTDIGGISDITTNVPFINSFIRDFAMWMLVQTIVVFSLSLNFDEMYIVKTKEISDDELYEQIREEINNNK